MPSLSDPRWGHFKANYTDGAHVAELLAKAETAEPASGWYDDLFQELCHQYTVSEAAYLAGPHLVRIATARPELRKDLLVLLGSCHAFSVASKESSMPEDVMEEWRTCGRAAVPLITALLTMPQETESDFRYLLCALAAVHGYPDLGAAIEALDADTRLPAD